MRVALSLVLSVCLTHGSTFPLQGSAHQQATGKPADQRPAATTSVVKQPLAFGLEDGTPVKLRLNRTISSADAHVNDTVDFDVLEEIKVHDDIVVARGSVAWGTVTEAEPKRRMARGGKLNVNIDDVRLASGEKVPLRAVQDAKGGGHTGAMVGAMVATAIVFFPAAPLFLFMKGKDITIPKGTEITAYINGDISLDPAKFAPANVTTTANSTSTTQSATGTSAPVIATDPAISSVEIKSTPDTAEITVDDKYRGSTPATLRLASGDHTIRLEKQGFKTWEKTLTVNGGENTTVNASLEQQTNPPQ
jgi:PEGA domain